MAQDIGKRARKACSALRTSSIDIRNEVLTQVRNALENPKTREEIMRENAKDMKDGDTIEPTLKARLGMDNKKMDGLIHGLNDVINMPDPINRVLSKSFTELDQGLELYRVSCPIGVLCIIFESRPEAAVQIASLAIKSGNVLILKGGKEATHSNQCLARVFQKALASVGLPEDCVILVSTREEITSLLAQDEYIDLVIPRGSNELVSYVKNNTKIPVLGHADGICSVFVDRDADMEMARKIVVDSKTQYPSVCNAAETLLLDEKLDPHIIQNICQSLVDKKVILHCCEKTMSILQDSSSGIISAEFLKPAADQDYRTEFLKFEMAVKIVSNVNHAIEHINSHGSHHTDAIVTNNRETAELFLEGVDSADVFHNASTRFADGFRFGFGAEVGVSTNRIHARGPVGLDGLMTYKYRLHGQGHIVDDYSSGRRKFTHQQQSLNTDYVSLRDDNQEKKRQKI